MQFLQTIRGWMSRGELAARPQSEAEVYKGEMMARLASASFGSEHKVCGPKEDWSKLRLITQKVVFSKITTTLVGMLIVANLGTMCLEVNDLASSDIKGTKPNPLFGHLDLGFQLVYTLEIIFRLYVQRMECFRCPWQVADVTIVMLSWIDFVFNVFGLHFPGAQFVKLIRIGRLSRVMRIMVRFPELYNMLKGFGSAMMAMFWGFVMISLLIFVLAILSVEVLHDKQDEIDYGEDTWCSEAFSSVFKVFLMFFQNLVAGDSWGRCVMPVIMWWPPMFIVFSIALVVQIGFTNLILSNIVESASISRQEDLMIIANQKKKEEAECLNRLYDLIASIDTDRSGCISIHEFLRGYDSSAEMRFVMSMLSIDRSDIAQLFRLMDGDLSGTVTYEEFINCIRKAETQDMRVQMMVLKLQVSDIGRSMKEEIKDLFKAVGEHRDDRLWQGPKLQRFAMREAVQENNQRQSCLSSVDRCEDQRSQIARDADMTVAPATQPMEQTPRRDSVATGWVLEHSLGASADNDHGACDANTVMGGAVRASSSTFGHRVSMCGHGRQIQESLRVARIPVSVTSRETTGTSDHGLGPSGRQDSHNSCCGEGEIFSNSSNGGGEDEASF
jgi:Ca2+-binding EF-hand superfamily protein